MLPGAAGTVQEIFQAATPLYYAGENEPVPPLVLHLVDTPEEAAEIVAGPTAGAPA